MINNFKHLKSEILIVIFSTISILLIWMPFYLKVPFWGIDTGGVGMTTVITNYDTPYYIAIADTGYSSELLKQYEFTLPVEYYAAHFPLYPLLINSFSIFIGTENSIYFLIILTSAGMGIVFYRFLKYLNISQPLLLTIVLMIIPARLVIARSVGTPEPLFIMLSICSLLAFMQKKYWIAGITGGLVVLSKPPGILLAVAYFVYLAIPYLLELIKNPKLLFKIFPYRALPLMIMPLSLLGLFSYYGFIYGSFWAYFESGDNIHLFWPPFQVFNSSAYWVGTFWLEDIVWLMLFLIISVIILIERKDIISTYVTIFVLSLIFVQHRDIARYALPMSPFLVIAFAPLIKTKYFKIALVLISLPIYLFSINFISNNYVLISDLGKIF